MNLDALREINKNNPEILENAARDHASDPATIKGISLFVVDNGYSSLSTAQKYHFDKVIKKLIENVKCDGYTHEFDEMPSTCSAILDDDDLVEYYQNLNRYCASCQGQAASDAHSKASFFKD